MKTTIYALVDPRNNEVRYIGKSERPESRYRHHCKGTDRTHNANWVKSIRPAKPKMIVVEVVDGEWAGAEQFWIGYFKFIGARLTNHTDGGEGSVGFKHSPESIAKMKIIHTNISDETRARMSEANRNKSRESLDRMAATKRGSKASPETRAKMSLAAKGQKRSHEASANIKAGRNNMSDEAKAAMWEKISNTQKGKIVSEETRAKMSASLKGRAGTNKGKTASAETRAKQSASRLAYCERMKLTQPVT